MHESNPRTDIGDPSLLIHLVPSVTVYLLDWAIRYARTARLQPRITSMTHHLAADVTKLSVGVRGGVKTTAGQFVCVKI